jgi:peptide/nickel transport system permease protein
VPAGRLRERGLDVLVFTIRRLVGTVLVLLVVSFVTFVFTASTYDPLAPYRSRNPQPPKEFFAQKTHEFHLDQPILTRYWDWLTHLVNFDWHTWYPTIAFNFGTSVGGTSVSNDISSRLGVTTKMIVGAIILAALLAIILGVISGVRHDKSFDFAVTVLTFILIALPTFWFAALLKQGALALNDHVFHRQYFFTIGTESPAAQFTEHGSELFWDRMRHLILPILSLGLLTASGWIRYQRASTIDVLDSDYMRLARAKGVRNRTVIRRHGLRNALIPLVTVMAIDIGALFGGAIITEKVYVWNAMGSYLNDALTNQDTYAVIGWVMVSALFVIIFNLIADLLYAALDPRIRLS